MITTQQGEKCAREVVKYFQKLPQFQESVKLLGIKVQLKTFRNAYEVARYIEVNYPQFTAHEKKDSFDSLSIGYKKLEPIDFSVSNQKVEKVARDVLALLEEAHKNKVCELECELELISIKVMLPEWADSEVISSYISTQFKEYRVHPKYQGKYPILAIGNRDR